MCVVCFSGNSDFFIECLKPSKMKSLQDFLSDSVLIFHLEEYYFLRHYKKIPTKIFCMFLTIICTIPVHFGLGLCLKYTSQEDSFFRQKGQLWC